MLKNLTAIRFQWDDGDAHILVAWYDFIMREKVMARWVAIEELAGIEQGRNGCGRGKEHGAVVDGAIKRWGWSFF